MEPSISPDGRIVAFYNRLGGYTLTGVGGGAWYPVRVAPAGQVPDGGSSGGTCNVDAGYSTLAEQPDAHADPCTLSNPTLAANGSRIAFASTSANLVAGDTNGREDVFSTDVVAGGAALVSSTPGGAFPSVFGPTGGSRSAALSGDATRAVFASAAADVATADVNGLYDVFTKVLPLPVGGPLSPGELRAGGHNPSLVCVCDVAALNNVTKFPVSTVTGAFWHTFADVAVPGRGMALAFGRTYDSSMATVDGPLGFGWAHPYAMSLAVGATTVTVEQENGSEVSFSLINGAWVAAPRVMAALVRSGDGTWTFTRRAREVFTFDATGTLTSMRDLNGETTTVARPSAATTVVSDAAGRALTLAFTGSHLTSVTDPAGRVVSFAYDANGDLVGVTDVGGASPPSPTTAPTASWPGPTPTRTPAPTPRRWSTATTTPGGWPPRPTPWAAPPPSTTRRWPGRPGSPTPRGGWSCSATTRACCAPTPRGGEARRRPPPPSPTTPPPWA